MIGFSLGGTRSAPKAGRRSAPTRSWARKNLEIEPRGTRDVARQRRAAARPDHHALPDLRRVLRRHQGGARLGHRDGQAVAERAVGDHRSDLPAPERRARRCRPVLRHHRQARRADQATAGQRQQDRRRARATAASRSTRCWSTRRPCWPRSTSAATRSAMLLERVESVLARRSRASSTTTRTSTSVLEQLRTVSDILGEAQVRPGRRADHVEQVHRVAGRGASRPGPYFKVMVVNLLPSWMLQPFVDAAFKKRGIDPEEFWRNAGLPVVPVPRPQRHAIPQRCAAAGARRCWRARPDIPARPSSPARRARTRRPPERSRRPGNPLPCAHLSIGPFGRNPYGAELPWTAGCGRRRRPTRTVRGSRRVCRPRRIPGELPPDMPGVRRCRCRPHRRVRAPCRWGRSP